VETNHSYRQGNRFTVIGYRKCNIPSKGSKQIDALQGTLRTWCCTYSNGSFGQVVYQSRRSNKLAINNNDRKPATIEDPKKWVQYRLIQWIHYALVRTKVEDTKPLGTWSRLVYWSTSIISSTQTLRWSKPHFKRKWSKP